MTRTEAESLVTMLAAAHPRQELSAATFSVYAEALVDLEVDDVKRAVATLIREHPYFPAVSEIRHVAAGGMAAIRPTGVTADEIERMVV